MEKMTKEHIKTHLEIAGCFILCLLCGFIGCYAVFLIDLVEPQQQLLIFFMLFLIALYLIALIIKARKKASMNIMPRRSNIISTFIGLISGMVIGAFIAFPSGIIIGGATGTGCGDWLERLVYYIKEVLAQRNLKYFVNPKAIFKFPVNLTFCCIKAVIGSNFPRIISL